jgi:hypothetical protein
VKHLRCEKCGITAGQSWAFVWYRKTFTVKDRSRQLWLCPDCAGEFTSDQARDAFLREALGETER